MFHSPYGSPTVKVVSKLVKLTDYNRKLAQRRLLLYNFDFEVRYNPARKQYLVDAMSRFATDGNHQVTVGYADSMFLLEV